MLRQYERVPHQYKLVDAASAASNAEAALSLESLDSLIHQKFDFQFEAICHNVFRSTFSSTQHPLPPYPSVRRPDAEFTTVPQVTKDLKNCKGTIKAGPITAVVDWSDTPIVSLCVDGVNEPLHKDLNFRSYVADDAGIAHYVEYKKGTIHVGLGEKAAPMDLSGRGFIISAGDTFGYDAYRTDPLYKHIPLLVNITQQGCVGIFSTAHSRSAWAVGSEIDGMWGHYKVYRQAHGGLEEYLIVGRTVEEVVHSYARLVGFPLLVPRYMMGYISGGMKYSMEDTPRAADAIVEFLKGCEEHDIPVSAFQMSSGYTVAETEPKTRNVFTWNRHRFPDPRAFTKECHRRGVRLLANIKPYVLGSHPEYTKLRQAGAFFQDPVTHASAVARLWSAGGGESGEGSHIDFTSKAGFTWWYDGCRALKDVGIDAMWNDNNEFNIANDDWQCALETISVPPNETRNHLGLWGRAMHTELMGKSSHEACVDSVPDDRPLVLTRSATAGTMRYASCSWSGDNVTSWEGMKGGNALALNAGFSLLPIYGHDIGGFEGPQPTAEHLVRWIQLGIHSPRFTINCYKTSPEDNLIGEVIEPWMHPSATPIIRAAIKRRYELVPYTYSLSLKAHFTALPPQRWTGWGYESDPEVWSGKITSGDTQYWFGDALIIAGVYEPGEASAPVYLPRKSSPEVDFGFLNTNAPFQHLESGRWHEISSSWQSSIPVLARCGSVVPVGKDKPTTCRVDHGPEEAEFPNMAKDDWRGVEIFPPPVLASSSKQRSGIDYLFENTWLEDDGISSEAKSELCTVRIIYTIQGGVDTHIAVKIKIVKESNWEPLWLSNGVDVILPAGEERRITALGAAVTVVDKDRDSRGRRVWNVGVLFQSTRNGEN